MLLIKKIALTGCNQSVDAFLSVYLVTHKTAAVRALYFSSFWLLSWFCLSLGVISGSDQGIALKALRSISNELFYPEVLRLYEDGITAIDTIINTCVLYQNNRKELENNIVSGCAKDELTLDWIDSGHTEKEKQIELSKSELRNTMQFLIDNAASMAIPKAVVTDQERIRKVNKEYRKSILGSTLTGKYLEWAKQQYLDL